MNFNLSRVINGRPVGDEEMSGYVITNSRVIGILYRAQKRLIETQM